MMILFAVLKIIGLVLLCVLCVILALLALVLFAPIVYQAHGDSEARTAAARARWLFGVLRLSFAYDPDTGTRYSIRLFGVQLFPRKEKTGRRRHSRKRRRRKHAEESPNHTPDQTEFQAAGQESVRQTAGPKVEPDAADRQQADSIPPQEEFLEDSSGETFRDTGRSRKGNKKEKFSDRASALGGMAHRLPAVIRRIRESEVLPILIPRVKRLLYHYRPRKLTGSIAFGFADPSYTGLLCGGISLLPALMASDLDLQPDFETDVTYFNGTLRAGGRIQLIYLLIFLVALIRRKEVRTLIRTIRKAG